MATRANETVGENFKSDRLLFARDQSLAVINEAAALMKPGHSEDDAKKIIQEIQTRRGAPKSWHPPQIRFGKNTVLPFGAKAEEKVSLQSNDIFFFDLGPLFENHEGDVGRAFAIGNDPEMKKCCKDAETIWGEVRDLWKSKKISGAELYAFAETRAVHYGWILALDKASGHRVADFPHAARRRGKIQSIEHDLAPNRWILEIQIRHPSRPFGAFFEDLLTDLV